MPTSKNFAWINFREWQGLKDFAWIYFRKCRDFEKYFSLKKRKTTLLSIKSFYKFSKNYKYVNNFYMFYGVWSMKASKALCDGAVWWKANSHWIYFRKCRDFEKYFSLKKRKTTLLSIKSFYKFSKNYKYVNNFYMFYGVWSMKASKALCDGAVWWKANSHCLMTYYFNCLKYAKKQRKMAKMGKIRKQVLFESPHTNFKHRRWILKFISRIATSQKFCVD